MNDVAINDNGVHPSEWGKELDALAHGKLGDISAKMFAIHRETVKVVATNQIEVGRLLLKAREQFKGDNEFGKWRQANTPITSRQTAHNLMKLAEQSGKGRITDKLIRALPTSTLAELITAPDSVLKSIEGRVEQGEHVTAKEIREEKKAEKAPDPTPISKPKASDSHSASVARADAAVKAKGPAPEAYFASVVEEDVHYVINEFVEKRGDEKVKKAMTQEWAMCIFGVPPYSDGVPRWQVFELMRTAYAEDESIKKWERDILDAAWASLTKMYNK